MPWNEAPRGDRTGPLTSPWYPFEAASSGKANAHDATAVGVLVDSIASFRNPPVHRGPLLSRRVAVSPRQFFAFAAPVTRLMYSTSLAMYGVPSGRKMSWNQSGGSAVYCCFHESHG